jgi:acyltransferase
MNRIASLDSVKGFLILLVLIGHIVQGSLSDNVVRYTIYSFHMPAFFFVSGFLLKLDSLSKTTVQSYTTKYLFRIGVPWLMCVVAYFIVLHFPSRLDLRYFLELLASPIIKPYYHLWFVLAFLTYVVMAVVAAKLGRLRGLVIFAVIALVVTLLDRFLEPALDRNRFLSVLRYDFRPQNLFFFSFGVLIRNSQLSFLRISSPLFLFGILLAPTMFYLSGSAVEDALWFILNLSMCIGIYGIFLRYPALSTPFLDYIGKRSLYVYLLHVFALLATKSILPAENSIAFLTLGIGLYLLVILGIFAVDRIRDRAIQH